MTNDIQVPCKQTCPDAHLDCPLYKAWKEHRSVTEALVQKVHTMYDKVDNVHEAVTDLMQYGSHLQHLEKLPIILDRTLDAALKNNHTDNKTVMLIVKILGTVSIALVFVIVALLTGAHLGWLTLK